MNEFSGTDSIVAARIISRSMLYLCTHKFGFSNFYVLLFVCLTSTSVFAGRRRRSNIVISRMCRHSEVVRQISFVRPVSSHLCEWQYSIPPSFIVRNEQWWNRIAIGATFIGLMRWRRKHYMHKKLFHEPVYYNTYEYVMWQICNDSSPTSPHSHDKKTRKKWMERNLSGN